MTDHKPVNMTTFLQPKRKKIYGLFLIRNLIFTTSLVNNLITVATNKFYSLHKNQYLHASSAGHWRRGGKRKESLQLHLWNLNI